MGGKADIYGRGKENLPTGEAHFVLYSPPSLDRVNQTYKLHITIICYLVGKQARVAYTHKSMPAGFASGCLR